MAQKESRDALQMLADDHRTVEALFEKYDNARGEAAQQKIVQQICQELTIHAMIEEQVFYPAIREAVDDDMMDEAQVEHDSAKMLILSLQQGTPSDAYYDAKVSVLKEQVEHHVYEEERQRGSIFAQVRKAEIDLVALGGQMAELKQRLLAQAKAEGLPRPELVALAS
ncbi:hemerythrin domain-containing protein [Sphingomonas ursincola]|uniref:Hemerythrin domain-containing protein n=1 Tax=Sphingomonas ursincola TaxID=56361 RepID=A0A7V8RD13_9SPHN|nr:hemerythrin domain-containing protein [Sphingomonas ursincola]MBA1373995.1 hemerythrin domain-containing protein [Sphingomonas ursincola]